MITIERSVFKTDPVYKIVYKAILANYRPATHTVNILLANKHVKDFCEESRHFAELPGNPPLYIHFDVSSWYDPKGAVTKIERIGIYDNYQEYQPARLRTLHSTIHSDGVNLN
jgi:hypothetical protein